MEDLIRFYSACIIAHIYLVSVIESKLLKYIIIISETIIALVVLVKM